MGREVMPSINEKSITDLRKEFKNDMVAMQFIHSSLNSFVEYAHGIYRIEIYKKLFDVQNTEREEYQHNIVSLDRARSKTHDAVIANIDALNRLCVEQGIEPVYSGRVSKDRPYRVQIADAVLEYVNEILESRQK